VVVDKFVPTFGLKAILNCFTFVGNRWQLCVGESGRESERKREQSRERKSERKSVCMCNTQFIMSCMYVFVMNACMRTTKTRGKTKGNKQSVRQLHNRTGTHAHLQRVATDIATKLSMGVGNTNRETESYP